MHRTTRDASPSRGPPLLLQSVVHLHIIIVHLCYYNIIIYYVGIYTQICNNIIIAFSR